MTCCSGYVGVMFVDCCVVVTVAGCADVHAGGVGVGVCQHQHYCYNQH